MNKPLLYVVFSFIGFTMVLFWPDTMVIKLIGAALLGWGVGGQFGMAKGASLKNRRDSYEKPCVLCKR